jgi:hypothetical protein
MSRLLDQDGRELRIIGCMSKLQKRRRLTRHILPADHHAPPQTLETLQRQMMEFVSTHLWKSKPIGFHRGGK